MIYHISHQKRRRIPVDMCAVGWRCVGTWIGVDCLDG